MDWVDASLLLCATGLLRTSPTRLNWDELPHRLNAIDFSPPHYRTPGWVSASTSESPPHDSSMLRRLSPLYAAPLRSLSIWMIISAKAQTHLKGIKYHVYRQQ
jgi:hypothetical protein